MDAFLANLEAVHPGVPYALVSARTGEGLDAWFDWLRDVAVRDREAA
jgi:Ni2+-binding GTPase involved in maturation of urease and hydrogenase